MNQVEGIYRKVMPSTWVDRKFRALSHDARLLWHYFLTGPRTSSLPGLLPVGRAVIADDMDMTIDEVDAAIAEMVAQGMARVDMAARLVWLPNGLKHNPPANPSIAAGWRKQFALLPECDLRDEAEQAMRDFLGSMKASNPADFVVAFSTGKKPKVGVSDTVSHKVYDISNSSSNSSSNGNKSRVEHETPHAVAFDAPAIAAAPTPTVSPSAEERAGANAERMPDHAADAMVRMHLHGAHMPAPMLRKPEILAAFERVGGSTKSEPPESPTTTMH